MSEQGCPVRGLDALCQVRHGSWPNPHNRQDGYPVCSTWRAPHHSDIATTLCLSESCERRVKKRMPSTSTGTAPASPSPKRIAEIRTGVPPLSVGSFSIWYSDALQDLLIALDAAESDNARLRAALMKPLPKEGRSGSLNSD